MHDHIAPPIKKSARTYRPSLISGLTMEKLFTYRQTLVKVQLKQLDSTTGGSGSSELQFFILQQARNLETFSTFSGINTCVINTVKG